MLEITVCMTILRKLQTNLLLATEEESKIAAQLKQHKIVLTCDLNKQYIEYCRENGISEDWLKMFLASYIGDTQHCRILDDVKEKFPKETSSYIKALKNACVSSRDKVLLSEYSKFRRDELKAQNIELVRKNEMCIDNALNSFTRYTFPIVSYQIKRDEDSKKLGEWLGRILNGQNSVTIYDNYFWNKENIENFRKYILKYIPKGADIIIITIETEQAKEADIVSELKKSLYMAWNIEAYLVVSKKDSHPRVISTPEYDIQLDFGLSTFGKGGKTYSSLLTIKKNGYGKWYQRGAGRRIFPVGE